MRRALLLLLLVPAVGRPQAVTMAESVAVGERSRVGLKVELTGQVQVPGKEARTIDLQGVSRLAYDERIVPADDGKAVLRVYRTVEFERTINGERQTQSIRNSVRRMVVLRSADGKKAPFSPDGPLTFGEIDAVRVDLFSPVIAAGVLPAKAVVPGDSWPISADAALDLTGLEAIRDGKLTAKYVAAVTLGGQLKHRISIAGDVKGVGDDGPVRQSIDATAYYDPRAAKLVYLSLKGIQELLDERGQVVGRLTGRLTLDRGPSDSESISDAIARRIDAKPTTDNSLLLYDNRDLGLRFVYPRDWRVGAVQGTQVTVESPKAGAGLLITVEPAAKTPTAAQFLAEAKEFVAKQKGTIRGQRVPERLGDWDRFALDVELDRQPLRMEYAVRKFDGGGATVAARLPRTTAADQLTAVERILKELVVDRK
jgi:hypothetical protein